jgi:hypothetical protein
MFKIEVDKRQMAELRKVLKDAPDKLKAGLMRKIFERALTRTVVRMMMEAPQSKSGVKDKRYASRTHTAGNLKRSIGIVVGTGTEYPTVWAKPRRGVDGHDAWYSHFPMMFHEAFGRFTTKKKTDYVRKAWNATKASVEQQIQSNLEIELKQLLKA